jgi:hypothetical protein
MTDDRVMAVLGQAKLLAREYYQLTTDGELAFVAASLFRPSIAP